MSLDLNHALRAIGQMRAAGLAASLVLIVACSGGVSQAETGAGAETLARFEPGTFLENLEIAPNGDVVFTNYTAKRLEIWRPDEGLRPPIDLGAHAMNVVARDTDFVVLAHRRSMAAPTEEGLGNVLMIVTPDGDVLEAIEISQAVALNGMALLSGSVVLLGDSANGRIWRVDLQSGDASIWFEDAGLAPSDPSGFGLNGLQMYKGALYLANSANASLYRLGIGEDDAPSGDLELVANLPAIDDFKHASDGRLFFAPHTDVVLVRNRDGSVEPVLDQDVNGATAVELSPDGRTLYALGTGGVFIGGTGEATLVRLQFNRNEEEAVQ